MASLDKSKISVSSLTSQEKKGKTTQEALASAVIRKKLDEAINNVTNGQISTMRDFIDKLIYDLNSAKNGKDFLKRYCGINIEGKSNEDTGAITGKDAGGSVVKTAESVVLETVPVTEWEQPEPGSSYTFNEYGLTITYPTVGADGETFTDNEKFIMRGLKYWIESSLALIKESTGFTAICQQITKMDRI